MSPWCKKFIFLHGWGAKDRSRETELKPQFFFPRMQSLLAGTHRRLDEPTQKTGHCSAKPAQGTDAMLPVQRTCVHRKESAPPTPHSELPHHLVVYPFYSNQLPLFSL